MPLREEQFSGRCACLRHWIAGGRVRRRRSCEDAWGKHDVAVLEITDANRSNLNESTMRKRARLKIRFANVPSRRTSAGTCDLAVSGLTGRPRREVSRGDDVERQRQAAERGANGLGEPIGNRCGQNQAAFALRRGADVDANARRRRRDCGSRRLFCGDLA